MDSWDGHILFPNLLLVPVLAVSSHQASQLAAFSIVTPSSPILSGITISLLGPSSLLNGSISREITGCVADSGLTVRSCATQLYAPDQDTYPLS